MSACENAQTVIKYAQAPESAPVIQKAEEIIMLKPLIIDDVLLISQNAGQKNYFTFSKKAKSIAEEKKQIKFFDTSGDELPGTEFTIGIKGKALYIRRDYTSPLMEEKQADYYVQSGVKIEKSEFESIPEITESEYKSDKWAIIKKLGGCSIFNNVKNFSADGYAKTENGYFVADRDVIYGITELESGLYFVSEKGLEMAYNYALTTSRVLEDVKALYEL